MLFICETDYSIKYTTMGVPSQFRRSARATAQWKRTEATEQGSLFFFVCPWSEYASIDSSHTQKHTGKVTKAGVRAHRAYTRTYTEAHRAHFILNAGARIRIRHEVQAKGRQKQVQLVYLNQFSQWTPIKITFEVNNNNKNNNKKTNSNTSYNALDGWMGVSSGLCQTRKVVLKIVFIWLHKAPYPLFILYACCQRVWLPPQKKRLFIIFSNFHSIIGSFQIKDHNTDKYVLCVCVCMCSQCLI